ncbi:MAG: hypothetical protein HY064_06485 [Bacteroidetes bacterium]|nr:hypothetical protein [Bacteroidota bacterium]
MKTIYSLGVAFMLSIAFVACGPSEAEKKADSIKTDSVKKDMNNEADSTIAAMNKMNEDNKRMQMQADSTRRADSARKADSAMKAPKGKGKKK